jgi:hypothetical protein
MFNKKISSTSRKSGLVFRTLIALAAISTPAAAASVQGIPNQVEYSATFLYVQHNSVNYNAQPAWLNLSQAALLS